MIQASIPLVVVMGLTTTIAAFLFLKRDMERGKLSIDKNTVFSKTDPQNKKESLLTITQKRFFAILVPLLFLLDVLAMVVLDLTGGDATALVGGTAILILLIITLASHKKRG